MSDDGASALPPTSREAQDPATTAEEESTFAALHQLIFITHVSLGKPAGTELLEASREEASGAWRSTYVSQHEGTRLDAVKEALRLALAAAAAALGRQCE